jgi:hypothetical protein
MHGSSLEKYSYEENEINQAARPHAGRRGVINSAYLLRIRNTGVGVVKCVFIIEMDLI